MIPIKLKLIAGPIGARMDFVAGWLGTLPNYINNQWHIDPITGQSNGFMRETKYLDHGQHNLSQLLTDRGFELRADAEYTWAGACHGFALDSNVILPLVESGLLEIVQITCGPQHTNEIFWNFLVKTFMAPDLHAGNLLHGKPWLIDQRIAEPATDALRIAKLQELASKHKWIYSVKDHIPTTKIDYDAIASDQGSAELGKLLNISVPHSCHLLWKNMLPLSFAPESIPVWGHTWTRHELVDSCVESQEQHS